MSNWSLSFQSHWHQIKLSNDKWYLVWMKVNEFNVHLPWNRFPDLNDGWMIEFHELILPLEIIGNVSEWLNCYHFFQKNKPKKILVNLLLNAQQMHGRPTPAELYIIVYIICLVKWSITSQWKSQIKIVKMSQFYNCQIRMSDRTTWAKLSLEVQTTKCLP